MFRLQTKPLDWIFAAFVVLALVEYHFQLLLPLENGLSDLFVRLQAVKVQPDPDIVLVDIHQLIAIQKGAFMGLLAQSVQVASQCKRNEQLVNALVGPTKELYARGLDKSDEFEADRMGVVIAARAGYDAWGLPNAIQTVCTIKPDDNAVALLFKTHPPPAARLEKLSLAMGTNFDVYASGQQNMERYQRATQGIRVAATK